MAFLSTFKNKGKKLPFLCGCVTLITLGISAKAMAATMYNVTDLGNLAPTAINDLGQVAANSTNSNGYTHASLWNNGSITDLGTLPGANDSYANGINNSDQVVGNSGGQAFLWNSSNGMMNFGTFIAADYASTHGAFYYPPGVPNIPGFTNTTYINATAINNAGQVVGTLNQPGVTHAGPDAFFWSSSTGPINIGATEVPNDPHDPFPSNATAINNNGQVTGYVGLHFSNEYYSLNSKSGSSQIINSLPYINYSSDANNHDFGKTTGINDAGQVVGYGLTFSGYTYDHGYTLGAYNENHAFLWSSTTGTIDLGTLPGSGVYGTSEALGINNSGLVVGDSTSSTGTKDATLWSNGTINDLNTLINPNSNWSLSSATAINSLGQIVGNGKYNGQSAGFLLTPIASTPVPEPTPIASTVLAGVGLLYLRRRQHLSSLSQEKNLFNS